MKNTAKSSICEQLVRIGYEFADLRRAFFKLHGTELAKKQPISMRGIWQDVVIDEEDLEAAKSALFPERETDQD